MISKGIITYKQLNELGITDSTLVYEYFGITVPCLISSPLREDRNPSFGLYSRDGISIYYIDYATKDKGSILQLLMQLWNMSRYQTTHRIFKELVLNRGAITSTSCKGKKKCRISRSNTELSVKVREWKSSDIEYWETYGIPLKWLKYAEVCPISHTIITKNKHRYVFNADKYAYAFVERKENNVSIKVYQPYSKSHKWMNSHNGSVIGLWTKIPERGTSLCICSSVKDALCLWSNSGIPCICLQGEGYSMSKTAVENLKSRFDTIYVCFDNDTPGLKDAESLCSAWGFSNIILPPFKEGKDISDFYKAVGEDTFQEVMQPLFTK